MGEIADMIIAGECCELCQHFFKEAQGYPCMCKGCYSDLSKEEKKDHQEAWGE